MKFPNAAKGIKKIFSAEILHLIGAILMIIAASFAVVGLSTAAIDVNSLPNTQNISELFTGANGTAAATLIMIGIGLVGIAFILYFIAFILNLVGYINARHDGNEFMTALVFLLISIVFSAVYGFTIYNSIGGVMYSLATLCQTIATIFVIAGVVKLADRLNRGDVGSMGSNILKLLITIEVIAFVVSLITTFMGGAVASVTAAILLLVAFILSFIKYIMYLIFLAKAKQMLAEGK